jgi:uncharacterized protein YcsI (UPF0317 family)
VVEVLKTDNNEPANVREHIRQNKYTGVNSGIAKGYVQANLVAIEDTFASSFERFCKKNHKSCPLLEIVGPGSYATQFLAKNADLRRDLPKYNVFKYSKIIDVRYDIVDLYKPNFVFFLIGCSFTFENALIENGIELKHIKESKNVSMYNTNIPLISEGIFNGNLVVSMRPIKYNRVVDAAIITAHYPKMHGTPIHIGYPELIGIHCLKSVDYGDSIEVGNYEIPVFWACGVSSQNALLEAKLPIAITHVPGHMFITDLKDDSFYVKIE